MTTTPTADEVLLTKLNEAVAAANEAKKTAETAKAEFVSRSKTVGLLLLEAKKLHPKVEDFGPFLKKVHGLSLSWAYELMSLAGGRKTHEELKKEACERKQRSRDNQKKNLPRPTPALKKPEAKPKPDSVTTPHVTESPEISIEQRRRENANLGMSAAERSKQNLEWFAVACREYLPKITVEAHRQEARRLVAELTQAKAA